MNRSDKLFNDALKLFPGGVNSPARAIKPYPFYVREARGSKLYSVDGGEYIDYSLGFGPLILGHGDKRVMKAVVEQLKKGWLYGAPYEAEIRLAKKIRRYFPLIEVMRFVNSGTEATMNAIRVARGYTGKRKIIKFEGNYHGSHDNVLVKAGSSALTFSIPTSEGILKEIVKYTLVAPYNNLDEVEKISSDNADDLAAIIVEPIAANMGLVPPEKDFLKGLREIAYRYDIPLIFDEVITGFRVAMGGAQEYYGIEPDLTTLGKVIGGGFPIGLYGGRREFMEEVTPLGKVHNAGTFNAHPISMVAGLKTIEILEETQALEKASETALKVSKYIEELIEDYGVKAVVNRIASMFQIFFSEKKVGNFKDVDSSDKNLYLKYHRMMMDRGVYMAPSQFETCFTSSAHSDDDLKKTFKALEDVLKGCR